LAHCITTVTPTYRPAVKDYATMDASSSITKIWHPKESTGMTCNIGSSDWSSVMNFRWLVLELTQVIVMIIIITRLYKCMLCCQWQKSTWFWIDFHSYQTAIWMLLTLCHHHHQKVHTWPPPYHAIVCNSWDGHDIRCFHNIFWWLDLPNKAESMSFNSFSNKWTTRACNDLATVLPHHCFSYVTVKVLPLIYATKMPNQFWSKVIIFEWCN